MGKVNQREELIKKIRNIEDKNVIDEIYRLLEIDFDDKVYKLSDAQQNEINEARAEFKRGEGISSQDVNKEMDEWLKK